MAANWRDHVPAARAQAWASGAAVYIVATGAGYTVTATQPSPPFRAPLSSLGIVHSNCGSSTSWPIIGV
jgi:hypothetical protein